MSQFTAPRPQALRLQLRKPRNPLVAPSLHRQAGRHDSGNARQQSRRELQQQIRQLGRVDSASERSP